MSEREERIDAAIRLVLEWRPQAPAHGGLAAAIHALAFEFHWPLADAEPTPSPAAPMKCTRSPGDTHACTCDCGGTGIALSSARGGGTDE